MRTSKDPSSSAQVPMIADDLGIDHPFQLARWLRSRESRGKANRRFASAVYKQVFSRPGLWRIGMLEVAGVFVGAAASVLASQAVSGQAQQFVWILIVAGVILVQVGISNRVHISYLRRAPEHEREPLISLALSRELCPACWKQFAGVTEGVEGFVVCSECGAAWHASRLPKDTESHDT